MSDQPYRLPTTFERLQNMSESTNNVGEQNAADPAEDHKTPGGQPGDRDNGGTTEVETTVETPGGTEVTETSVEGGNGSSE